MPPKSPTGSPAASASSDSGRTPIPSTTTSAGYSASEVTTARARPCSSVRISVTSASLTIRMPSPVTASCTSLPMSGSRVVIGSGARLSSVTS